MSGQIYISVKKAAEIVGVNERTIWRWVRGGDFPSPSIQTGGATRWAEQAVRDWCARKKETA
ncbi:AlpA family transcriptional regulator [Parasaccharibacter sp. TMW2.1882]|uniref:helix-turn-helix transcriptional regulator n=1 Tax=Parasaccharibacter sp. TMW2.1882 TaxID=2039286 RepID=UPI00202C5A01|nr:AlpA family transcriptional regulator [Parasaccharibacter sp. TMW2.1882]